MNLTNRLKDLRLRLLTASVLVFLFLFSLLYAKGRFFPLLIFLIGAEITIWEWPRLVGRQKKLWLLYPFYIFLPLYLCVLLNRSGQQKLILLTIFLVAVFDSGAYLVGSLFGKHKLCPQISPNKSWEGLAGGFLFTGMSLFLAGSYFKINLNLASLLFIVLVGVLATLGDFFESWLKRRANLKDSGTILPGHGGFLDRLDAPLFLLPIIFFYSEIISKWVLGN